jgi:hypothetical protein
MGGAVDGQHAAYIERSLAGRVRSIPQASLKRADKAEALAQTLQKMLRTPLSRATRRTVWTLLDKVLNKALDYDARILHPESFSSLAERLDNAVRAVAIKTVDVHSLSPEVDVCVRLSARHGGCDVISAHTKMSFSHLAGSCQYLPAVAERLLGFGFTQDRVDGALDLSGVSWCLQALRGQNIH